MSSITRFLQYDLENFTPIRLESTSKTLSETRAELKFTIDNLNSNFNSNAVFLILGKKEKGVQIINAQLLDLNKPIELSIKYPNPYLQSSVIEFIDKLNDGYFNDSLTAPTYNYEYDGNVYQLTLLALN